MNELAVYVINLDKNRERLKGFAYQYKSSDLNPVICNRFKGIVGMDIQYDRYIDKMSIIDLTPGMVGCYLSHYKLLAQAEKQFKGTKDYIVIFEDDSLIDKNIFHKGIKQIPQIYPEDWDIILLGHMLGDPSHSWVDMESYFEMYNFWGTHCYIVKMTSVSKILYLLQPPIIDQIDGMYARLSRNQSLKVYGITHVVAKQQPGGASDVQTQQKSS